MAGLFAAWAMYRSSLFDRIACMSGSLWYPGFREFALREPLRRAPGRLVLSLGDREALTRHPVLRTVRDTTEALRDHWADLGVPVSFTLHPGNHFARVIERQADGIKRMAEGER